MNEIEKMYENAEVEQIEGLEWVCQNPDHCVYRNLSVTPENCLGCEYFGREMRYPPFTAEKQLKIVKMILFSIWWINLKRLQFSEKFDEGLAQMINELWQDLTEEEKQQIKEILDV